MMYHKLSPFVKQCKMSFLFYYLSSREKREEKKEKVQYKRWCFVIYNFIIYFCLLLINHIKQNTETVRNRKSVQNSSNNEIYFQQRSNI